MSYRQKIKLFIVGLLMGAADLVPGVSGGTIAFMSGYYEELISYLKKIGRDLPPLLIAGQFRQIYQLLPWSFFIFLGGGIVTAIFSLVGIFSYWLEHQPVLLWSFFLGLVIASALVVYQRIGQWNIFNWVVVAATMAFAYVLFGLIPVATPTTWWAFFLAGMISICATILPGISGSFVLVILGKYHQIIMAVNQRQWLVLIIFLSGCLVGLLLFSQLLNYLLHTHRATTLAALLGLMLGSVRKVWPWREEILSGQAVNTWPTVIDQQLLVAVILIVLGVTTVYLLDYLSVRIKN